MGKYARILDYLEKSVPEYAALKVVPRGTPIFPDLLLSGQVKFARRLGANFAVLNVDNQMKLTVAATSESMILNVDRVLEWLEYGALLTFNNSEMLKVQDWDPSTSTIMLTDAVGTARDVASVLTLWATPLKVFIDQARGSSTLTVLSRYALVNGDVLTLPLTNLISSLREIQIIQVDSAGTSGDPNFPNIYRLTLSEPLPISLTTDSDLFLRAYPSYLSNVFQVPSLDRSVLGPFVLDYVSSPLDSIPSYPETFSVRVLDGGSQPVVGTNSALRTVDKNFPITQRPIQAESLIFWTIKRGSGGFTLPNKYRLIAGSDSKARVQTRVIPNFYPGVTHVFPIKATTDCALRVYLGRAGFQDYELTANVLNQISITAPTGTVVDRIEFIARFDNSTGELQIGTSTLVGSVAASIQYGYTFQVVGSTNFQATSLVVKPYFLTLSDLTTRYDQGDQYDSGLIYL